MRLASLLSLVILLAGCATQGKEGAVRTYDLGAQAPKSRLPALRAVAVRAAMPYDGTEMYYRLAWRDASEISPFAHTRWAAPPPELVRRQLLRALPESASAPCALEVELQDFSQVFPSKDASEARLELRAALSLSNGRVASRSVSIAEPGAGTSAPAGAAAFSRAAERAIAELSSWIASQAACKG